jgi:hypothetical protein
MNGSPQLEVANEKWNPLTDELTRRLVLESVGPGHWLTAAAINKACRDTYERVPPCELDDEDDYTLVVMCGVRTTLCSAVFSSEARLQLAHDCGLPLMSPGVQRSAGRHAGRRVLELAHGLGMPFSSDVMKGAAQYGRLIRLKWLHEEKNCQLPDDIADYAARSGSVDMLRWLSKAGVAVKSSTFAAAVQWGHVHVMEYLYREADTDCGWDSSHACDVAAKAGDLDMLDWLADASEEVECWDPTRVAHSAAEGGQIEVMQWLKGDDLELTVDHMGNAACEGHLHMIKYLLSEGCPWDHNVIGCAAYFEHYELLHWLWEHGCPRDVTHISMIVTQNGSVQALEYLAKQGVEWRQPMLNSMLHCAGVKGKLKAAQWLRERGAEWPTLLRAAGDVWPDEAVAWARQQGCTAPTTL